MEGIRDGSDARPDGQLRDCLFHREFRSDGRAYRRLHYCRARADAHGQGIPDDARRRVRRHPGDRRGNRWIEHSICGSS